MEMLSLSVRKFMVFLSEDKPICVINGGRSLAFPETPNGSKNNEDENGSKTGRGLVLTDFNSYYHFNRAT